MHYIDGFLGVPLAPAKHPEIMVTFWAFCCSFSRRLPLCAFAATLMETAVTTLADGKIDGGIYDMMNDTMMKQSTVRWSGTITSPEFNSPVSGFWQHRECRKGVRVPFETRLFSTRRISTNLASVPTPSRIPLSSSMRSNCNNGSKEPNRYYIPTPATRIYSRLTYPVESLVLQIPSSHHCVSHSLGSFIVLSMSSLTLFRNESSFFDEWQ